MKKANILICFILLISVSDLFAQIDSVQLKPRRDYSLFEYTFFTTSFYNGDTIKYKEVDLSDYSFQWFVNDIEQINDTLPSFHNKFTSEGNYKIKAQILHISSAISAADSIQLPVQDTLLIPNVFSPNGDGINDDFIIMADGITPLEIAIYSRTGVMIYKYKAPVIVWDGRNSSGAEMSAGVYYYILKSDNPTISDRVGFIHLFRE